MIYFIMDTTGLDAKLKYQVLTLRFFGAVLLAVVFFALVREAYRTNFPRIENLPEAPKALPFIGHLLSVGGRQRKNDSTVFTEWGDQLGAEVYQCCFGDQRTVIVNTFDKMKAFWIDRSNALMDRPHQPGFIDKLGLDFISSSLTEQVRRCRLASMKALGKPMWPKYYHLLEPSSVGLVRSVYEKGRNGKLDIDVYPYLQHVVFDLALSMTYGVRFGEFDTEFMTPFLDSLNAVNAVRASTKTFRHFVPLLRLWPERTSETIEAERIRRKHLEILYGTYQKRVAEGETVDCIVNSLSKDKLSDEEIHGTCVSMLQAAPVTVASGMYQCIAWLSSPAGQTTQAKAYTAILDAYNGDRDRAWNMAFREEKVPLIVSLCKETLRYFTFTPYSVPRRTSREIKYGNVTIPKGITIILNSQQANHDTAHYGLDAMEFQPERFIGNDDPLPHLTFGAGGRICPAVPTSNRIMYAVILRLLLAFNMREAKSPTARKPVIDPIHFSDVHGEVVAHPRFYDRCFVARDEQWLRRITAEFDKVSFRVSC